MTQAPEHKWHQDHIHTGDKSRLAGGGIDQAPGLGGEPEKQRSPGEDAPDQLPAGELPDMPDHYSGYNHQGQGEAHGHEHEGGGIVQRGLDQREGGAPDKGRQQED